MTGDRLSPLDSSFLHLEDRVSHMHIGSIAIFEGPEPPFEQFVGMVAGKLPLVPRYRQVVREVPLDLRRPVRVDEPDFHIDYHVRHTDLAAGRSGRLRTIGAPPRVPGQALHRRGGVVEGVWSMAGVLRPTRVSTLNGPTGPHRRYAWAGTSVEDVKAVRKGLGGTFNDV